MPDNRQKGLLFEQLAQKWLNKAGLKSLEQNFNCRYGEIDLIMLDQKTLCFIEVKYRKNNAFGGTAYSIPLSKQHKITHSALHYIQLNRKFRHHALRFDALFIQPDRQGNNTFDWIQNAFCVE
jgi:putative endonuclease